MSEMAGERYRLFKQVAAHITAANTAAIFYEQRARSGADLRQLYDLRSDFIFYADEEGRRLFSDFVETYASSVGAMDNTPADFEEAMSGSNANGAALLRHLRRVVGVEDL